MRRRRGSGDLELLELAADALRAAGLASSRSTLGRGDRARAPRRRARRARRRGDARARAEGRGDARRARRAACPCAAALLALPRLHGGREALEETVKVARATRARVPPAERLLALFDAASARGLGPFLTADAGEVRGFAYYTGTIFSIYADGPGRAHRRRRSLRRAARALRRADARGRLRRSISTPLAWALARRGRAAAAARGRRRRGRRRTTAASRALRARGIPAVAVADARRGAALTRVHGDFAAVWNGATLFDVRTRDREPRSTHAAATPIASQASSRAC